MLAAYRPGGEIRIRRSACLSVGAASVACPDCVSACPVGAVLLTSDGPTLSRDCHGCGRCAAVCPTAALAIDAFLSRQDLDDSPQTVVVACHRVEEAPGGTPNVVVRCLAALSPADWLEIFRDAEGRPVTPIDPGVCSTCPAGRTEAPWVENLAIATRLLAAAALPPALIPVALRIADNEHEDHPEPGRRRLLSFAVPLSTRAIEFKDAEHTPFSKRPAINVRRQAVALNAVSERIGSKVYALPTATLSAACDGCGVCAAICPTPALRLVDGDNYYRRLSFEGTDCVQCGRCAKVCPKQAIGVAEHGGSGARSILRSFVLHICAVCDEAFVRQSNEDLCPTCQRTAGLAGDDLFGGHHGRKLISAICSRE